MMCLNILYDNYTKNGVLEIDNCVK